MARSCATVILDEPCARLRDAVAAFAPVLVFKASRGFLSSPLLAAEELPGALAAAGVAPPYVYVAASFGGFAALAYARRHAALSSRGELRLVPGAGHDLVGLAPAAVLAAIREFVVP